MASNRHRLGVALVVDPPLADEVEGLRRALGDPSLERLPPHLTLVPPVNVRPAEIPAALAVLRRAAATQDGPLQLTLGPVGSFLPDNPVLFLSVGGDLDALKVVRDAVFAEPLERPLSWPWVPHVTVADGVDPAKVQAGVASLDRYAVLAEFDRLVLLEEHSGRIWTPLADAVFGSPVAVGTGGLVLEISEGRMLDPEALRLVADAVALPSEKSARSPLRPVVLTGRREGEVVGVSVAHADLHGGHVGVFVAASSRRQGVGSHLLAHLETRLRRAGWPHEVLRAKGPPGFYRARSKWCEPLFEGD